MKALSLLAAVVLSLVAASAQAQEFVRAECGGIVQPSARLAYETPLHAAWYRRFWTGSCKSLPKLQCMPGNPNWNDVVSSLAKKAPPGQAHVVTQTACRMGQTIGHEWSRAKVVRRITTVDLKSYMSILDAAPDVSVGMGRVDAQVTTALAGPPKGR